MNNLWPDTRQPSPISDDEESDLELMRQEVEWRRCAKDIRYFSTTFVRTRDQLDPESPHKPLPDLPYLWWFLDVLQVEPLVAVPKSRRVLATWLVTVLDVWECLYKTARKIGVSNEDLGKAQENLLMHKIIYDNLPAWMRERAPMKWSQNRMSFPTTGCEILAFEQDPNVFRMHTFSRIWQDEAQAQRHPADMYAGALPTVKGRDPEKMGQLVYTGTPCEGWFQLLCHDQLERPDPPPPAWEKQLVTDWLPPGYDPLHPTPYGVILRRLHDSGFLVVQIHYTADPAKRTPEWYRWARAGTPQEDWDQDYELKWDAKAGKPAIPQIGKGPLSRRSEIVVPFFRPPLHWVRFSSHDYGTTNPYSCHFHAISPDGVGYTYWEHYAVAPLGVHLDAIKAHEDFHRLRVMILDRSCWAQTQQATETVEGRSMHMTRSVEELHRLQGVYCIPAAAPDDRVRIERIQEVWPPIVPNQPLGAIRWHVMDNCPHLLRECEGSVWEKLSYTQKQKRNDPEKLVDKDNHAFDEFCYALLHLGSPDLVTKVVALTDAEVRDQFRKELQQRDFEEAAEDSRRMYDGDDDGLLDD